jgi:hypothetical protein
MNIIIRNIDPTAIKKFDELAKEKGISPQEFLKGQLETQAFFCEQTKQKGEAKLLHLANIKVKLAAKK